MDTQSWVLLFVALFLIVIVLALVARARRSTKLDRTNPYVTGDDTTPQDGEFGRDRDLDIERRRDADFDNGT